VSLVRVGSWIDCLLKKSAQENTKLTVCFTEILIWETTRGRDVLHENSLVNPALQPPEKFDSTHLIVSTADQMLRFTAKA